MIASIELTHDATALERLDSDAGLDGNQRRALRALTEKMLVVPETTDDGTTTGLYTVFKVGDSPGYYTVELATLSTCDCPDMQHYDPRPECCKHVRRVKAEIAAGRVPEPGAALSDDHRDILHEVKEDLRSRDHLIRDMIGKITAAE